MIATVDGLPSGVAGFATGRGTAALVAAVDALDLAKCEILVPVNICAIAVLGLIAAGARPMLHDVSAETGNTTLDHLDAAWRPTTAGLLAVHNFGQPLDMAGIVGWARQRQLRVIEDTCNALGATAQDVPVGTLGDAAIYSFGSGKIADAGEGGAVTASSAATAARLERAIAAMPQLADAARGASAEMERNLRQLRNEDPQPASQRRAYQAYLPHLVTKLDAAGAAAIDRVLSDLPENISRRRQMARLWRDHLAQADVELGDISPESAPWRYNIRVDAAKRDAVVRELRASGHSASTWYPPIDDMFTGDVATLDDYPGARAFAARVINLWVDESVDEQRIAAASATIAKLSGGRP
jgi:dTDP-4-amino-4,6-dideoxygalactose transaminase